jgi:two-component system, LuxR family, response regulator FixJ
MEEHRPTVFLIGHDPAATRGVSLLVGTMDLAAESCDSVDALREQSRRVPAGCILLEVRAPTTDGLALLETLKRGGAALPIIVTAPRGDVPTAVRAIRGGALNCLEWPCSDQGLREAIEEAVAWDARQRKRAGRQEAVRRRLARLSAGEREVLRLLLRGESNRSIAARLQLSVRTIEVRRAKLMRKMRAESLAELVRLAMLAETAEDRSPEAESGRP